MIVLNNNLITKEQNGGGWSYETLYIYPNKFCVPLKFIELEIVDNFAANKGNGPMLKSFHLDLWGIYFYGTSNWGTAKVRYNNTDYNITKINSSNLFLTEISSFDIVKGSNFGAYSSSSLSSGYYHLWWYSLSNISD